MGVGSDMSWTLVPTLPRVEILLWLLPAALVTVIAMVWAGWMGRERRGEVDEAEALRRMGEALERSSVAVRKATPRERERSTGVAVRRTHEANGADSTAVSDEDDRDVSPPELDQRRQAS